MPPKRAPHLTVATPNTTLSSPTACNVLMCVNVVGMFLHSTHFGWVRSAGSRGLAAFEEVVALHGVPSYIEVGESHLSQPIPLNTHRRHDLSDATVVLTCNTYGGLSDENALTMSTVLKNTYVGNFGVNGGSGTHCRIHKRKIGHVRFVAGSLITEVGDEDEIAEECGTDETEMWARSIELVGCENVTRVRHAMLYNYKHITSVDLSPLRNVTEIGMLFLASCLQLKLIDLSPLVRLVHIGDQFMRKCKSLTSINFTGLRSLSTIGEHFMTSCEFIEYIDLSPLEGLTSIAEFFLVHCRNLKSILLPNATGLTTIPCAFLAGAKSLTSIDLQPLNHVTRINAHFLSGCKRLTSLDLTPLFNVTHIEGDFLDDCNSLFLKDTDQLSIVLRDALSDDDGVYHDDDLDTTDISEVTEASVEAQ